MAPYGNFLSRVKQKVKEDKKYYNINAASYTISQRSDFVKNSYIFFFKCKKNLLPIVCLSSKFRTEKIFIKKKNIYTSSKEFYYTFTSCLQVFKCTSALIGTCHCCLLTSLSYHSFIHSFS